MPLLIRSHGGVTPTADGRALLPYFEKMCAMQHQLEQQAADLRGLETGLVKVATFTSVSEKWLPNILKTFQAHYPHFGSSIPTLNLSCCPPTSTTRLATGC